MRTLPAADGPTFLPVDIGKPMLSAEPVLEDRVVVSPLIVELCLAQIRYKSKIGMANLAYNFQRLA